jgi:hypothetical protein
LQPAVEPSVAVQNLRSSKKTKRPTIPPPAKRQKNEKEKTTKEYYEGIKLPVLRMKNNNKCKEDSESGDEEEKEEVINVEMLFATTVARKRHVWMSE